METEGNFNDFHEKVTYNCSDILKVLNEQQNPSSVLLTENNSVHGTILPCHTQARIILEHVCITFCKTPPNFFLCLSKTSVTFPSRALRSSTSLS